MNRVFHSLFGSALVAVVAMLCACGGENTTSTTTVVDSDGIATIAAGDTLLTDDCNAATIGTFVYVEDSLQIFHCTDWGWRSYTGRDGKAGQNAKNGKDGANGKDAQNGKDGYDCTIDNFADGFSLVCGTSLARILFEKLLPDTCAISSVESDTGFNVTCGKDSVWQKAGVDGRAGRGCSMVDRHNGEYDFVCPGDTVKVYAAQCGGKPYDPKQGYCVFDTLRTPEEYKKYSKCWEQAVDWSNHFCDTRDGHVYLYEKIGDQVWMAENLAYADSIQTPSLIGGHDCSDVYNGCGYTWGAAIDSIALARDTVFKAKCGYKVNNALTCQMPTILQGVCPEGWHMPFMREYSLLKQNLGDQDAYSFLSNRDGHQPKRPLFWTREFWTREGDGDEAFTMVLYWKNDYTLYFESFAMNDTNFVRCVKDD